MSLLVTSFAVANVNAQSGNVQRERTPSLTTAVDSTGAPVVMAMAGPILEVQYHDIDFRETGQVYVSRSKTITPPANWQRVFVSVAGWDLSYGHEVYEQALTSHVAALAGVKTTGSTVEVVAVALIREPTSSPGRKWAGRVKVQAVFLGR
jgi:hypothetical protein